MSEPRAKRRGGVLEPTVFAIVGVAILIGLGIWQLDRKTWKENLIATVTERFARAPEDLPPRASWPRLKPDDNEYRRVTFPAEFLDGEEALVYTAGSPFRPDVKGPGYWVFAPAQLAGGSIVMINRGFVPPTARISPRSTEAKPHGIVDIVGVMRWPEQARPVHARRRSEQQCLVFARPQGDRRGQEMGDRRAVLYRSGIAGAVRRPAAPGQARRAAARQSPAIRHHLVRPRAGTLPASMWSGLRGDFGGGGERFLVKAPAQGYCGLKLRPCRNHKV